MQLMPATARRFQVNDPYDPLQNIRAGARYLRELRDLYHGDLMLALAAYNAGPGVVNRFGGNIPPYAETQRYVPKVLRIYRTLCGKRV
jgi:soluble lytic murein transglycosylase-like protein